MRDLNLQDGAPIMEADTKDNPQGNSGPITAINTSPTSHLPLPTAPFFKGWPTSRKVNHAKVHSECECQAGPWWRPHKSLSQRVPCHLANKGERMQDSESYSLSNSVSRFPESPPDASSCWRRQVTAPHAGQLLRDRPAPKDASMATSFTPRLLKVLKCMYPIQKNSK